MRQRYLEHSQTQQNININITFDSNSPIHIPISSIPHLKRSMQIQPNSIMTTTTALMSIIHTHHQHMVSSRSSYQEDQRHHRNNNNNSNNSITIIIIEGIPFQSHSLCHQLLRRPFHHHHRLPPWFPLLTFLPRLFTMTRSRLF